jgi:hypothetical protein
VDDDREMFAEVNALLAAIAKALDLDAEAAVKAIEANEISMGMDVDEEGHNFVAVSYRGKVSRIYQGAIKHAPVELEEVPEDEDACGHGGCGCGR